MKIDRHNYEDYFLLYVDNELTADQKRQVESFVNENSDLEEEFVMFQQSKLVPDPSIVFDKKDLLMKKENDLSINLNNCEEWIVLYVDDELNAEEKIAVEKFAANHPQVQEALSLFQQTKLQPETIVFANKKNLYKSEKVVVISMQWWKVAVAAILILAAGITFYSTSIKKDKIEPTTDRTVKTTIKKSPSANPIKSVDIEKKVQKIPDQVIEKNPIVIAAPNHKKPTREKVNKDEENNPQVAINSSHPVNDQTGVSTQKHVTSDVIDPKIEYSKMNDLVVTGDKTHKENFNEVTVTKNVDQTPQPIYASNTENKRLRGFFRKATRFIQRTTNINPADDDNKVLIGGMAINLK
ncbi:MAG TPA: hypothetical protein VK588_04100 [Chitinophagaceae bacterium]|nr:hypothetical protein [Chitinophagaceae bacterium]